jgi:hypothetical protein
VNPASVAWSRRCDYDGRTWLSIDSSIGVGQGGIEIDGVAGIENVRGGGDVEMRLPGRAWLQFEVEPGENGSLIRQTAIFDPVGLMGQLYWYALYPIHRFVFAGMLSGIVRAMRRQGSAPNAVAGVPIVVNRS